MHVSRLTAFGAALMFGVAQAQTLHHRSPSPAPSAAAATSGDARQALPVAAEGEYRWGEPDEVIELYVENGLLRGYMTRRSERGQAASVPMTFAFAEAAATGSALSFSTRRIHGDWYSFKGQVARGTVATRRLDGYYLLEGKLSLHLETSEPGDLSASAEPLTRQVALKLSASKHPEN